MANPVGELFVSIGLNTEKFEKNIKSFGKEMNKVGKDLGRIGSNMTRSVTYPLIALNAAMFITASKSKEMRADFERMGNASKTAIQNATNAFAPFIAVTTSAATQTAKMGGGIADAFAKLPEPIRLITGLLVGLLAVAGPLIIAFTAMAKFIGGAFVLAVKASLIAIAPLIAAIAVGVTIGTALAYVFGRMKVGTLSFTESQKDAVKTMDVFKNRIQTIAKTADEYNREIDSLNFQEAVFGKTVESISNAIGIMTGRIKQLGKESFGPTDDEIKRIKEQIDLNKEQAILYKLIDENAKAAKENFFFGTKDRVAFINSELERTKEALIAISQLDNPDPNVIANLQNDIAKLSEKLAKEKFFQSFIDSAAETWQTFKQGWGDAIGNAIVKGESFSDAMRGVFENIASSAISNLVNIALQAAVTGLFGGFGGAGAGASGGIGSILGSIFGFAEGGIVSGPTLALVGERGPEMIVPLNEADSMMGQNNTSISFNIQSLDPSTESSVIVRQRTQIERMIMDSISRGGDMTGAVRTAAAR